MYPLNLQAWVPLSEAQVKEWEQSLKDGIPLSLGGGTYTLGGAYNVSAGG